LTSLVERFLGRELPIQAAFREWIRLRRGGLLPIERRYVEGVARTTGLPADEVLRSEPFRRFREALRP
jgi:hypothetical protein